MQYKLNHIEHPYDCINRQAETIRRLTVDNKDMATVIGQLEAEKQQLTEAYNQLAIKLQSTERQLETMKACDADKARQLKGFHSEDRRRLNMAVVSPDRNFDSKPRKELW